MSWRPGPLNLLTDVAGLAVGNAEDQRARTGVTVILCEGRAVAAVDSRGGAPGTRETDALDPACLVDAVDALVLSGGSVYGLGAADAVVAWLGARGRGFPVPGGRVAPVVPAAILFDLANGGDKDWGEQPPYAALGHAACAAAGPLFALGNAGAGFGAGAGAYKGGLGSASAHTDDGFTVAAIAAVNSWGSPAMPGGTLWAAPFERDGEMGHQRLVLPPAPLGDELPPDRKGGHLAAPPPAMANTTIAAVATDAALTPAEAKRLAIMAQDGLARALRPAHAPFDGDTVFALATGRVPLPEPRAFHLARLGALAADTLARAIGRGVFLADAQGDAPAWRSIHPSAWGPR